MKRVGIALGAGGARGLAHIVVLEALEELGIVPAVISGTSIGAVVAAALAAGLSTSDMRRAVDELRASRSARIWNFHDNPDFQLALAVIDPTRETGGLIKGEKFLRFVERTIGVTRFDELKIPLRIVATDYWRKEEVILKDGDLLAALRASYSMPGLFTPVTIDGRKLVDGGLENPLPFDVLRGECDITVAIDVSANLTAEHAETPRAYDILFFAYQIMQNSIVREKLLHARPDILIKTNIRDVRSLEFNKLQSIYDQAVSAKEELKRRLSSVLPIPA